MMHVIIIEDADLPGARTRLAPPGYRWACTSNAGLPRGKWRMTFLPDSAFLKSGEKPRAASKPRPIQDWLNETNN